jgi:hypothetical protein
MKRLHNLFKLIFMGLLLCAQLQAQSPQGFPYQGVARNNEGIVLPNQSISMRFTLHDTKADGPVVFQEVHKIKTNALGLFNCVIGQGNPVAGSITEVNWGVGYKYIQVGLDDNMLLNVRNYNMK